MGFIVAALVPTYGLFGATLIIIGMSAQTFTTSANSLVQLSTDPAMRGRVIAILLAVTLGGTPIGAPLVGWVVDAFGPRLALGIGAAAGIAAALVGVLFIMKNAGPAPLVLRPAPMPPEQTGN